MMTHRVTNKFMIPIGVFTLKLYLLVSDWLDSYVEGLDAEKP